MKSVTQNIRGVAKRLLLMAAQRVLGSHKRPSGQQLKTIDLNGFFD